MDALAGISEPATIAGTPPRKRRRPALSCAECRRRKIKCDRNIPCRQCTQFKSAKCTYSPERLSSVNSPATMAAYGASLSTPQGVSKSLGGPPVTANLVVLENSLPPTECITGGTPASSTSSEQSVVQTLMDRVQRLEQALVATSLDAQPSSAGCRTETPAKKDIDRSIWHKTRFYGQSHWVHPFEQVCSSAT